MGIKKKLVGFTLIEMIVVIAVIAVTLPSIFAIVFGITRQQTKIYRISKVKKEGDYILNLLTNTIRNSAVSIHSSSPATIFNVICRIVVSPAPTTSLYFLDSTNNWFGYSLASNVISSSSSNLASPIALNSNKILINNFLIGCEKTALFSNANITINFDICYDTGGKLCTSVRPEEFATLHYQTIIRMKN